MAADLVLDSSGPPRSPRFGRRGYLGRIVVLRFPFSPGPSTPYQQFESSELQRIGRIHLNRIGQGVVFLHYPYPYPFFAASFKAHSKWALRAYSEFLWPDLNHGWAVFGFLLKTMQQSPKKNIFFIMPEPARHRVYPSRAN